MNKVFLLISFLLSSPLISSISPPIFPDTFFTEYTYIFKNSTTTNGNYGLIAEDDMNKLMVLTTVYPSGFRTTLFNQALYYITGDNDRKITECVCFKSTYVPYFGDFKKFDLYSQSEDEIIWQVTGIPLPDHMKILFRVKKATPNLPEENMILISIPGHSPAAGNTTYHGFISSNPGDELFIIPDFCTKVSCKSTPFLKKDQHPFPNDWNNGYFI